MCTVYNRDCVQHSQALPPLSQRKQKNVNLWSQKTVSSFLLPDLRALGDKENIWILGTKRNCLSLYETGRAASLLLLQLQWWGLLYQGMPLWKAKIPLLQLRRRRSLCQRLWSVNNLCLDPRVCLSWWGAALLSAINGLEQFCWLCYRDIVQSSSLNYTLSERKRKERTAELDVNWSTDKDVKVYLRSRMVESSEVSLLRRPSAVGALLKVGICGLCEEVPLWKTASFILERVTSRIGVKI